MKKIKIVLLVIAFFICIYAFLMFLLSYKNMEMDCINSYNTSGDNFSYMKISVVLNRNVVSNKYDVADEIIKKCEENSFKTIKFSYDRNIPNKLDVYVYLKEKDFDNNNVEFHFEYKYDGDNYDNDFNILDDKEKFKIFID